MDTPGAHAAPSRIVFHTASQTLELAWPDGKVQRLPAGLLREHCPCSKCEAARIARRALPTASLEAARAVGEYGLQLSFSDGHDRGIYPWSYLLSLGQDGRVGHQRRQGFISNQEGG